LRKGGKRKREEGEKGKKGDTFFPVDIWLPKKRKSPFFGEGVQIRGGKGGKRGGGKRGPRAFENPASFLPGKRQSGERKSGREEQKKKEKRGGKSSTWCVKPL